MYGFFFQHSSNALPSFYLVLFIFWKYSKFSKMFIKQCQERIQTKELGTKLFASGDNGGGWRKIAQLGNFHYKIILSNLNASEDFLVCSQFCDPTVVLQTRVNTCIHAWGKGTFWVECPLHAQLQVEVCLLRGQRG